MVEIDGLRVNPAPAHHKKGKVVIAISHRSSHLKQIQDFINDHKAVELIQVSSSVKLCMIADGTANLYPRFGTTMEWDIAAGHALILASGGDILCLDGTRLKYGKRELRNSDFVAYSKSYL